MLGTPMLVAGLLALAANLGAPLADPADPADPGAATEPASQVEGLASVLLVENAGESEPRWVETALAHLEGLSAAAVAHPPPWSGDEEPAGRWSAAEGLGAKEAAVAVVWVEAEEDGVVAVYLARPGVRALWRRDVSYDAAAPQAGLEALGVVIRGIVLAVLEGQPPAMEPVALPPPVVPEPTRLEPEPPPPAETAPTVVSETRGRATVSLGYVGTSYATEIPWQSGVRLELGWRWRSGARLDVGFDLLQRVRASQGPTQLELRRYPLRAAGGYEFERSNLRLAVQGLVIFDYTTRHATVDDDAELSPRPDRGHSTVGLGARVRGAVAVAGPLEVFVGIAVEAWPLRVGYEVETASQTASRLLTPRAIRGTVAAGFGGRF